MGGGTALPSGTVTFLFSDIEGSTRLLLDLGDDYEAAIAEHRKLLREAFAAHNGHEMGTEGDSFAVAFSRASDGVGAALAAQLALAGREWDHRPIRVRMGVHTGEVQLKDGDYFGLAVHQAARVSSAAHGGQILVSQTTKDLVGSALPDGATLVDLGEHRLKDLAQPTRLYNLSHSALQAELPPPRTLSVLPNNLPLQLTTFVGREEEIAKVTKLLEGTRVVTLSGAGGSGKTRLALQIAADLVTEYRDGAWFADLSPINDPDQIVRGVAESLGLREEQGRPIEDVLIEHLQGKDLLIVVDNCEHMAEESAAVIDRLLHAASGAHVLATSRETLGIEGETVFRVPSLDTPGPNEDAEALTGYEAVRLFSERAVQATADFKIGTDNAQAIGEICRRLDGMPLAIELAAARVRMLTPQEIAKRLDDRFKLLTGGLRAGMRRQQTLRAAVDWSYEMLSGAEQLLFRRLSVFVGGFTLEAAEGVCSGDGIEEVDVFDLLSNLVDRSLVVSEPVAGETRFRLLETMREYGRESLAASGEAPNVWSRHLKWFAELAVQARAGIHSSDQAAWLTRMDTELENVRQALSWSLAGGDPADGVKLTAYLYKYWQMRWYIQEARRWIISTYERCADLPVPLRAAALECLGLVAWMSGDLPEAIRFYEESSALPREPEALLWIAESINDLGLMTWGAQSDPERATEYVQRGLELRREIDDSYGVAESLGNLSSFASFSGDFKRAKELGDQAMALRREVGQPGEIAFELTRQADFAIRMGDLDRARAQLEEAVVILRSLGDRSRIAQGLTLLGNVARFRGDYPSARELYEEAMEISRNAEDQWGTNASTTNFAHSLVDAGDFARARELFTYVHEHARSVGSELYSSMARQSLAQLDRLEGRLDLARDGFEEALSIMRKGNAIEMMAQVLPRSACVHLDLGEIETARALIDEAMPLVEHHAISRVATLQVAGSIAAAEGKRDEALRLQRDSLLLRSEMGLRPGIAQSIEALAWLAADEGHAGRAAKLLAAAESQRADLEVVIPPVDRARHDAALAAAKAQPEEAFLSAWNAGAAMTAAEAVAFALGDDG